MPPDPDEEKLIGEATVRSIAERISPHMNECGVVGFVMVGYVKGGDGKVRKVSLGGFSQEEGPVYQDALRSMEILAAQWAAGRL